MLVKSHVLGIHTNLAPLPPTSLPTLLNHSIYFLYQNLNVLFKFCISKLFNSTKFHYGYNVILEDELVGI